MGIDILVVSPCSGRKRYDAVIGPEEVDERERPTLLEEFSQSVAAAAELYTGREHNHIQTAVQQLRSVGNVDWRIISAGFGVLAPETEIPAYDCTFSDTEQVRDRATQLGVDADELTNNEVVQAVGRKKSIPQDLKELIATGYDLVFIALGTQYLIAAQDALAPVPDETTPFAFASEGSKQYIGDCEWLPATEAERRHFGTTWLELRGRELRTLAENIRDPHHLERLQSDLEEARHLSTGR